MGRAAQQVLAHERRFGMDECHHVLQLVTETESTPGLIVAAARPESTCECLINQPAVGQYIECLIRGLHLHGTQSLVPVLLHGFEGIARHRGTAGALHELARLVGVAPGANTKDKFTLLPLGEFE